MAIVTFWNSTDEQCGTTSGAIAFATQVAIEHNIKVLLISTSFNERLIKDSFWKEKKKSAFSFLAGNNSALDNNGVEGLDRIIRSNKVSPEIIKDYTQVVLSGRFEILLGLEDSRGQYDLIKERYSQIISLAGKYYDLVVVDLDNQVGNQTVVDILKGSDIIVSMVSQRAKQIEKLQEMINKRDLLKKENTIITLGRYMEGTKYNAKNISRNLLKTRDLVNTIPYNNLFFEATQEATVIDLFLNLTKIKDRDTNYFFVQEIKRLYETIQLKLSMKQNMI